MIKPFLRGRARAAARALLLLGVVAGAATAPASGDEDARFRVTPEVVNPELRAFTATIPSVGSGSKLMRRNGAFEPIVYRDAFVATADAPDRVVASAGEISRWDTLSDGALDGAQVDIYRIVDGAVRRVRRDRVREGGHHASGWTEATPHDRIVDPECGCFLLSLPAWSRPGAEQWFAVRAVGVSGALSAPSEAVSTRAPAKIRGPKVENALVAFDPKRRRKAEGPEPPRGLAVAMGRDGVAELTWQPSPSEGVAGYVVLRSDLPPEKHRGWFLELEGGEGAPPVRAGDLMVLDKTFLSASRDLFTNRVWGADRTTRELRPGLVEFWPDEDPRARWRLAPHAPGSPVEDAGETYLEVILDRGRTVDIGTYNHAGVDQDWYPTLEPTTYVLSLWLRGESRGRATFRLDGPHKGTVRPQALPVGPEWRRVEVPFRIPAAASGRQAGRMSIELSGPGRFDIDNVRVRRADTPFLAFTPEEVERLRSSGMGALRTHGFVKTGHRTYDLEQLTNPAGVISGVGGGNTLPQILGEMERTGMDPWLQIEPHFSPEEWLGLVEYLAAPYDPAVDPPGAKPWARKRWEQGRAEPWTDAFDRILFELGNETWNRLFRPWVFDPMPDAATGERLRRGEVYGLFMEHVIETLRSSPWWSGALEEKMVFALGGWRRHSEYGYDAARRSPSSELLAVAAYNGGWDEGEGPPDGSRASFVSVLNQVSQSIAPSAADFVAEVREIAEARGAPLAAGSYEAGPGYALDGLNGARVSEEERRAQEEVMKSQAAGVATLDSFLTQAALGFDLQNYFMFSTGELWTSHADWHEGGHAWPAWRLLSLFNREALGDMLRVETLSAPRADLPAADRRPAAEAAPLIAAYATRRGDRLALVVVSRRAPGFPEAGDDGWTPVTVELPFETAETLTLHRMAGPLREHDVGRRRTAIERIELSPPEDPRRFTLDAATGFDARGLPPGSAAIYVFEGISSKSN